MQAKVTWGQGMSFTGSAETGFSLPLGADSIVGGANDGFRPLELMAVSLAGCTAMDVISILRKKQQQVSAFEVRVETSQAQTHPHIFEHASILYHVTGHNLDESALLRAIELSALKYCPAMNMLSKVFPIDLVYEIYQADGTLVKRGQWQRP